MGRSQRHLIEQRGYDSSGDVLEEGAVSGTIKPPTLASLAPSTAVHGTADITVTATGTGFKAPMSVNWSGQGLAATVVNDTTLTFKAPISQQGFAVTKIVKVNAGPYESAAVNFSVT